MTSEPSGDPWVARILERLAGSRPGPDPQRVELARDRPWPRSWQSAEGGGLRAAGVLLPVVDRPAGPTLLFTRRSGELKHHAGQVSFPGGSMEEGDSDIVATALRETTEEVGVATASIRVAGTLRTMPTITGYAVTPVVGLLPGDVRLTLDPAEVELAFEVPLTFLLDETNERRTERRIEGVAVPLLEYLYGGERIWGATANMIAEFRTIIK